MSSNTDLIENSACKRILFLNHRLDTIGGIETRWMDEFRYLNKHNYQVYLFVPLKRCNQDIATLYTLQSLITTNVTKLDIATEFIKLVNEVINAIRINRIDVISIHMLDMFSCAAVMAAQICRTPVISTIHGTPDIYRKPIHRLFCQQLIDKSLSLSISVSQHLKSIYQTQAPHNVIIPNLINLEGHKFQHIDTKPAWLIINRISSEKYPSILRFLQAADASSIFTVDIVGGGKQDKLRKLISKLNINLEVNFLGEVQSMESLIPKYSGIAGMGRAVIEGLAFQKPVCVMSPEGDLIGLVTKDNFEALKNYNFIGKTLAPIDNPTFSNQLNTHTVKDSQHIYHQLQSTLSTEKWDEYIALYQQVKFIDNPALEALYHKLAYFSVTLSSPFINDKFFQDLFYETLIEHDLNDIETLWLFYEKNHGLNSRYPNPLKAHTRFKKKWQSILKIF